MVPHVRERSRIRARVAGSHGLMCLYEDAKAVATKVDSHAKPKGRLGALLDHRKQRMQNVTETMFTLDGWKPNTKHY